MGFDYCGISDHSKTARYAGGIIDENIQHYIEEINRINDKYPEFKVFKGIESDILPDGELDYDDRILEEFDLISVVSDTVHLFGDEEAEIKFHTEADKLIVESDNSQMRRMFINLIRNSIQAKASTIKIKIGNEKKTKLSYVIQIDNNKVKYIMMKNSTMKMTLAQE